MRIVAYGGVSTLSATCAVLAAFRQRANFYAAAVYLSKSNACMMILCNFGIFCTIVLAKILQSIFFGQLRLAEIERLHDRLWFTISETLLALAMFRDEFDTSFVVLFISLVFVKCFHWLAADRVDWMDQAPTPPGKLFHARMVSILSIIWITDMLLIAYATESVLLHGPSVVLMFEMEYVIMQVTCLSIISKYVLNSYAHYRAQEHWEEKSTYQFYINLATDFLKLITYIGFLSLTLTFHALPINVLRDVYYTFRSFVTKCNNLVRFRQATRNMNERYPNATREEMEVLADKTCIICREEMEFREDQQAQPAQNNNNNSNNNAVGPNDTPKKLGCGHIFHFHCLRSWLERQQTCPTCRRPVIQSPTPTQAVPPNPANRAFAAAMAAAGVGPPPIPPAPPANGRGDPPAAQPAQPQQAGAGDGNLLGPRPDGTRSDLQQRLREFQQRMNAGPFGPNGAPTNGTLESGSQNTPNTLRLTGANPLVSFDLSTPLGTSSVRSSTLQPSEAIQASSSSSHSSHLGLSTAPAVPTSSSTKDMLTPGSSSQPQTGTSRDQSPKPTRPASSSDVSELPQVSGLNNADPTTGLQSLTSGETKNPLQSFRPWSSTLVEPKEQRPTSECSTKSYDSKKMESSSSVEGQRDAIVRTVKKAGLGRLPCLIPLFDHNGHSQPSLSDIASLNHQLIINQYAQKMEELNKFKIGNSSSTNQSGNVDQTSSNQLLGRNQLIQLIEIQNGLIDCCSKLANLVQSDDSSSTNSLNLHHQLNHSYDANDEKLFNQTDLTLLKGKNKE